MKRCIVSLIPQGIYSYGHKFDQENVGIMDKGNPKKVRELLDDTDLARELIDYQYEMWYFKLSESTTLITFIIFA